MFSVERAAWAPDQGYVTFVVVERLHNMGTARISASLIGTNDDRRNTTSDSCYKRFQSFMCVCDFLVPDLRLVVIARNVKSQHDVGTVCLLTHHAKNFQPFHPGEEGNQRSCTVVGMT
ncbi:unnamed protein product [Ixodes pacificus]